MTHLDSATAAKFRSQHGLIARYQAFELGMTDRQISWRLDAQVWEKILPRVYRLSGVPESWHQQMLAAALAAGPHSVVSHRTALALWGLPRYDTGPIEISSPRARRMRLPGIRAHQIETFREDDVSMVDGISVTLPTRTFIDLSGWLQETELGQIFDELDRRHLFSRAKCFRLVRVLVQARGRKPETAWRILQSRLNLGGASESVLETNILGWISESSLPLPRRQYWIHTPSQRRRIDLAYPEIKLAIEIDGFENHAHSEAFHSDRAKDNQLARLGWRTIRFTSATTKSEIHDILQDLLCHSPTYNVGE